MKYDDLNLKKIREVPIFDVCSKLGITLYGTGKQTKRTKCWYHDDKHPSIHVNKVRNIYKCFVCGKGGDVIKLVMDNDNKSFIEACDWLVEQFHIVLIDDAPVKTNTDRTDQTNKNESVSSEQSVVEKKEISAISAISCVPSVASEQSSSAAGPQTTLVPLDADLVSRSMSLDSVFCRSAVSAGYLTESQLRHAASRYRLGASKDGGVIFWEIDDQQQVHTGKIMYYQPDCHRDKNHNPTWVHSLLKDKLPANYNLQHCLFGLNLLTSDFSHQPSAVCIVESEKTAVIMSILRPEGTWMSCGGLQMFKPELLAPLVNHKVVVFPDTDETGEAYKQWLDILQQAAKTYPFRYPLRISRLLEDHATPEQKARKIDIVDYLFHTDLTDPTDSIR